MTRTAHAALDRRGVFGPSFMKQIAQGPLLQTYPLVRPGVEGAERTNPALIGGYASEGNSPSYWYLLPTGLRSEEYPTFGGWGGRFAKVGRTQWTDRPDALGQPGARVRDAVPLANTTAQAEAAPLTRWIPALQNDFLGRSRWISLAPAAANHEPVVRVERAAGDLSVRPGQQVTLAGNAADPDGDRLAVRWWRYREAGTYAGDVKPTPAAATLNGAGRFAAQLAIPADAKAGETIHVIAEVTDAGAPALALWPASY